MRLMRVPNARAFHVRPPSSVEYRPPSVVSHNDESGCIWPAVVLMLPTQPRLDEAKPTQRGKIAFGK
jgi:hypothetical protein